MHSSHSYPSYAPDPGSRRLPRPVGDRRMGVFAAVAAVAVAWIGFKALAPDLGYDLRVAWTDLNATILLEPVEGSPDPTRVAELLRRRLRHADLTSLVVATNSGVRVQVERDLEATARAWVLPQGDLQLMIVSDLQGAFRDDQLRRVRERKAAGTYLASKGRYHTHPHPDGAGEVLLERVLELPRDAIATVEAIVDDAGRPALAIQLSASGYTVVQTLLIQAEGRALAVVVDGELLSLNRTKVSLFGAMLLSAGQKAYEPGALDRLVTILQTRLPGPMTPAK